MAAVHTNTSTLRVILDYSPSFKHTMKNIDLTNFPLSQPTCALSLATTPRHVLYALPTPICCPFLVSTQRLLPVVSALLRPQFGTHSPLTYFPSSTFSSRPTVPPSRSHKCLRFGLWSTLRTIKILFTYLLTYFLKLPLMFAHCPSIPCFFQHYTLLLKYCGQINDDDDLFQATLLEVTTSTHW